MKDMGETSYMIGVDVKNLTDNPLVAKLVFLRKIDFKKIRVVISHQTFPV